MAMGNVNTIICFADTKIKIYTWRHFIDICSYLQVFFIIKVYFPNLDWVGHEINLVRLDAL